MADDQDKDSKTLEPTEKKINDAIEKGNQPQAREAAVLAMLVGAIAYLVAFAVPGALKFAAGLAFFFENSGSVSLAGSSDVMNVFRLVVEIGALLVLPVFVILPALGIAASALQNVPRLVYERIRPQASRISLAKGWTRIFGSKGLVEFLKSVFKFATVTIVIVFLFDQRSRDIGNALFKDIALQPGIMRSLALQLAVSVLAFVCLLTGADFIWSRFSWRRDLMMSHKDVKDEMKDSEGDALLKSRFRTVARERNKQRMMTSVPLATLVISNPTHFAIAMRYSPEEEGVPVIVAKGKDLIAQRIKAIATEHGISLIEDVALARAMYPIVEVGQAIPAQFYKAVAEIIHHLARIDNRAARHQAATARA